MNSDPLALVLCLAEARLNDDLERHTPDSDAVPGYDLAEAREAIVALRSHDTTQ